MKITGFTTRLVAVPRDGGPVPNTPTPYVTMKLQTDAGIEGIGYTGFGAAATAKALKETVDAFAALIVGTDPEMVEATQQRLLTLGGGGAPAGLVTRAAAGIDIALWDIKGKAANQPLYKLLGGHRDKVPAYASGWLWRDWDVKRLAETAPKLVDDGWRAMKFRLGAEPTAARELERVRVMREAVGPDIDLMIDINQGWDVNRSIAIGRKLADYGTYWLEDPVHHQDFAGLARIAAALDTPIAAGEYHYGLAPFRQAVEQQSVDIVMVDIMRAGGITGWMKVARMAEVFNMPVVTHLAPEIQVHTLAACPNGTYVEWMPWSTPMFKELPQLDKADGKLIVPQRPGLGLEFDEAALDRFAM